jgi:hypothetical protein
LGPRAPAVGYAEGVADTAQHGANNGPTLRDYVKDYLEDTSAAWFDGLTLTHAADGATTLAGSVRDQTALYGLLDKARNLGLTLLTVVAATEAVPLARANSAVSGPRSDIE